MKRVGRPQIVDINLLPREQRPADLSPRDAGISLFILAAIVALLPLSFFAADERSIADAAQQRVAEADVDLQALQRDLAQHRAIRFELDETNTRLATLREERALLQGGARPLAEDLAYLWGWGYLPPPSRLQRVSRTDFGFVVSGTAPGPLDAIAFAERLVREGRFAAAQTTAFTPGQGGGEFTIEVRR